MSIHNDLKAYVDGELSPGRAEEVERAVGADPVLAKEVEMLRGIGSQIKSMASEAEVVGLERTISAVKSRRRPRDLRAVPLLLQLGFAGVAVAFLAVILFPVFAQRKDAARLEIAAFTRSPGAPGIVESPATAAEKAGLSERRPKQDSVDGGRGANYGLKLYRSDVMGGKGKAKTQGRNLVAKRRAPVFPQISDKAPSLEQAPTAQRLIKTAELALGVRDVHAALTKAIRIAKGFGGYAESSNASAYRGGLPEATVTLRVREEHFETAVQRIKEIDPQASILQDSVNGEDVTAQYVDTESKLKTLRAAENRYRSIMGQTKKIGEVLNVQERLDQVRTEIEGLEAQKRLLSKQSALSTIEVTFQQRPEAGSPQQSPNWPEDTWSSAVNGLLVVLRSLAVGAMYLFVFSPIWLPGVAVIIVLFRRALRS